MEANCPGIDPSPVQPLRIALLGYRSAPFSGGQGVYLRYLSRALVALGHEVTVISGPPYPHLDPGVRLVELPSLDLYQHGLASVTPKQLKDRLARVEWFSKLTGGFAEPYTFGERVREWLLPRLDQFDVIHDNQTLADGIIDLQRTGVPVVTTIHHPITRDLRVGLAAEPVWYRRLLVRRWHHFLQMQTRVARSLRNIVTVSSLSARDIVADFGVPPGAISVMPNGVDTEVFRPWPEVPRHPRRLIATASADAPLKGLSVLLRALANLVDRYPDVELTLIARPKPGGPTDQLIDELGLRERIHFEGGLTHEEIATRYAASSIAVVPSIYEGFGLPAIEAMACGMPLVSSDGGALREVVADGGVLVPAGDPLALAEAIAQLFDDPARREALSAAALTRVRAEYCWNVCARRLTDYYQERLARC
ncbi:MAG: glycosyltransferase family 4 protein [Halieaceae bacterium]|nr:glycosyltransferase family 4 protein [Halieaceae bacterium]